MVITILSVAVCSGLVQSRLGCQRKKMMRFMKRRKAIKSKRDDSIEISTSNKKKPWFRRLRNMRSKSADASTEDTDAWTFLPRVTSEQERSARRDQVMNFVVATLKKGPNGLIEDFRKMKRTNDFTKMTEFVQQNAKGKNRYKDVGCLDNNRVILTMGNCPYIHANYVSTPENPKRFICTQAPLPATCEDFWYMVVQESSEVIIMLCNFIEQKSKKCAEYYPQTENGPLTFNEITVTAKKKEDLQFPFETPIKIEVTHLEVTVGGQTHPCTHYHWVDWPDRCVPAADSAPLYLLNLFAKIKTPIVIHCSAGIGRTGSMVLLQNAMEVLLRGEVLNEMNVYLEEVRKQRNNSVQTDQQYLYVHQVLLMYLRTAAYLPDSILAGLDAFTAAYNTATSGF